MTTRPLVDLGIWVDASTDWGVGVVFENNKYAAWQWKDGWRSKERHIFWAEAVAVELALQLVKRADLEEVRILIRGDNQAVRGAFEKGRTANWEANQCIRRVFERLTPRAIIPESVYVNTKDNLADPISRGIVPAGFRRVRAPDLPSPLSTYLHDQA